MSHPTLSASMLFLALLGTVLWSPGRETAAHGTRRNGPLPGFAAPAAGKLLAMADGAACGDTRNRLYLIDGRLLFWDRAGSCIDDAYGRVLFGAASGTPLCRQQDGMLGRVDVCADERDRALFERLVRGREAPDLGLGAGHVVQAVDLARGTNS
jgi:hypothetical protein